MIGVAIDPGLRGCGLAVFDDTRLIHASYVKNPASSGNDFEAAREMTDMVRRSVDAVVNSLPSNLVGVFWGEVPRIYPAGNQKGDQNDLIHLAGFVYMIAGCSVFTAAKVVRFHPREWKGTIDAHSMLDRIIARLSTEENASVRKAGSLTHNVIDAVGIGLHAVGRLAPKRVFRFES